MGAKARGRNSLEQSRKKLILVSDAAMYSSTRIGRGVPRLITDRNVGATELPAR
jgi:hypothetical protein